MKKQDHKDSRRGILRKGASLLGVTLCPSAITSLLSGCEKDSLKTSDTFEAFELSEEPELSKIGGAVKRTFGQHNNGRPIIIVRTGDTGFIALSSICTHLGCEVNLPSADNENIHCPCHGSQYLPSTGEVVQGPAPASLQKFNTIYENDVLKILF